MKKNLPLKVIVAFIAIALPFMSQAQVREIKMYADADATIFRENPTLNRGHDGNNMICNNDSALDGLSTLGYEEAWIKWDLAVLESQLEDGEEILYAEAVFVVSWNSPDTNLTQGYHALHMADLFDGWNEGNGTSAEPDNLNGITWNSAKGIGDFELEENYETILVKQRAGTVPDLEIVPVFDAVSKELGDGGNKTFTLRMAPVWTDPNGVKKWLGLQTRQSPWNGYDEETGIAINAPHLLVYVGVNKSQFSDEGDMGLIESYNLKPSEFGYWLVGEDEGDDRLLLNKATTPDPDKSPSGLAIFDAKTYQDLEMSVEAKMNEITASGAFLPFNDFVMVFGYEDEDNFSYFQFIGINESGTYKVVDGVRTLIGAVYPIPPVSDTLYHTYKITRTGSEVVAYVDDVEYHRVNDDALNAEGKIGLGSHNNTVFFDDFTDGNPGETSLKQSAVNHISVFPNPAKESVIIKSEDAISSYKLVSIIGNTVLTTRSISSTSVSVDISNIPAGVYFMVAEMQNGSSATSKIIIE